jgi:hypothetical protein
MYKKQKSRTKYFYYSLSFMMILVILWIFFSLSSLTNPLYILQQQPATAETMTTLPSLVSDVITDNSSTYDSSLEIRVQARTHKIINPNKSIGTSTSITNKIDTMQRFLTYENPIYQIKIQYPVDWEKKDQELGGNNIVKFVLPQHRFPSLFLQIEDLNSSMPLDEYSHEQINHLRQLFRDINIIETNTTTLAGNNAYKVVYTFTLEQINYKKMDIWTIKDNKAYIINYLAETGQYSSYLPTIQKMVDSFEIMKE